MYSVTRYSNNETYVAWQLLHGRAFVFARTDWEYVFNTFAFGYALGYHFIKSSTGSCNGNFLGIGKSKLDPLEWIEKNSKVQAHLCICSVVQDVTTFPGSFFLKEKKNKQTDQIWEENLISSTKLFPAIFI